MVRSRWAPPPTEGEGPREGQRMAIGQWAPPAADEIITPMASCQNPPQSIDQGPVRPCQTIPGLAHIDGRTPFPCHQSFPPGSTTRRCTAYGLPDGRRRSKQDMAGPPLSELDGKKRWCLELWAARKLFCGGGMAWAPGEGGGGVPEMGFRAGPFVLCKDGCCHQRRWNTKFGPENFFHEKIFPHICVVKMISATWGSF